MALFRGRADLGGSERPLRGSMRSASVLPRPALQRCGSARRGRGASRGRREAGWLGPSTYGLTFNPLQCLGLVLEVITCSEICVRFGGGLRKQVRGADAGLTCQYQQKSSKVLGAFRISLSPTRGIALTLWFLLGWV